MNEQIDSMRKNKRFRTISEVIRLSDDGNTILDPFSVLLGVNVEVGEGNTFYPNVVIECDAKGSVKIGNNNIFYPGGYVAVNGDLTIGNGNTFGPAGCTIQVPEHAHMTIQDNGRYCNGAKVMGATTLGAGSQILGDITVQACVLGAGGDFNDPNPDNRGAVLKGSGLARNIILERGQVINGKHDFSECKVEQQSRYHPKLVKNDT